MFDIYRNETIGDATTYVRPRETVSTGLISGENTLRIFEEKITVLSDGTVIRSDLETPELSVTISDPTETFDVVNPTTGEVTGSLSLAQIKTYLYSMYLHFAAQRDEADAQQEGPLPG